MVIADETFADVRNQTALIDSRLEFVVNQTEQQDFPSFLPRSLGTSAGIYVSVGNNPRLLVASSDESYEGPQDTSASYPPSIDENTAATIVISPVAVPDSTLTVEISPVDQETLDAVTFTGGNTIVTFEATGSLQKELEVQIAKNPTVESKVLQFQLSTLTAGSSSNLYDGLEGVFNVTAANTDVAGLQNQTSTSFERIQGESVDIEFTLLARPTSKVQTDVRLKNNSVKELNDKFGGDIGFDSVLDKVFLPTFQPSSFDSTQTLRLRTLNTDFFIGDFTYQLLITIQSNDACFDTESPEGSCDAETVDAITMELKVLEESDEPKLQSPESNETVRITERNAFDIRVVATPGPDVPVVLTPRIKANNINAPRLENADNPEELTLSQNLSQLLQIDPALRVIQARDTSTVSFTISTDTLDSVLGPVSYGLTFDVESNASRSSEYVNALPKERIPSISVERHEVSGDGKAAELELTFVELQKEEDDEMVAREFLVEGTEALFQVRALSRPLATISFTNESVDGLKLAGVDTLECTPEQYDPCGIFGVRIAPKSPLLTFPQAVSRTVELVPQTNDPLYNQLSPTATIQVLGGGGNDEDTVNLDDIIGGGGDTEEPANVQVELEAGGLIKIVLPEDTFPSSSLGRSGQRSLSKRTLTESGQEGVSVKQKQTVDELDGVTEPPESNLYSIASEFMQVTFNHYTPNDRATMNVSLPLLRDNAPGVNMVKYSNKTGWRVLDDFVVFSDDDGTLKGSVEVAQGSEGIEGCYVIVYVKPRINDLVPCSMKNQSVNCEEKSILHKEQSNQSTSLELENLGIFHSNAYAKRVDVSITNADEASDKLLVNVSALNQLRQEPKKAGISLVSALSDADEIPIERFEETLRSLSFTTGSSKNPQRKQRGLQLRIVEANNTVLSFESASLKRSFNVDLKNDAPKISTTESELEVTEQGPAVRADVGLELSDPDTSITKASVELLRSGSSNGSGLPSDSAITLMDQDTLDALPSQISVSVRTRSVLIQGLAPPAEYQKALRGVKIQQEGPTTPVTELRLDYVVHDDGISGDVDGSDGQSKSAAASRDVAVMPVNDPPVLTSPRREFQIERYVQKQSVLSATLEARDPDDDDSEVAFEFSCRPNVDLGTLNVINNKTGDFTYTPAQYVFGTFAFTYRATDGKAQSNTGVFTIFIRETNAQPVVCDTPQNGNLSVAAKDCGDEYCQGVPANGTQMLSFDPDVAGGTQRCDNIITQENVTRYYISDDLEELEDGNFTLAEGKLKLLDTELDGSNNKYSTSGKFKFFPKQGGEDAFDSFRFETVDSDGKPSGETAEVRLKIERELDPPDIFVAEAPARVNEASKTELDPKKVNISIGTDLAKASIIAENTNSRSGCPNPCESKASNGTTCGCFGDLEIGISNENREGSVQLQYSSYIFAGRATKVDEFEVTVEDSAQQSRIASNLLKVEVMPTNQPAVPVCPYGDLSSAANDDLPRNIDPSIVSSVFRQACQSVGRGRIGRSDFQWPKSQTGTNFTALDDGANAGALCGSWHVHCEDKAPPIPDVRRLSRAELRENSLQFILTSKTFDNARVGLFPYDADGGQGLQWFELDDPPAYGRIFQVNETTTLEVVKEVNESSPVTAPVKSNEEPTLFVYLPDSGAEVPQKSRVRGRSADSFSLVPIDTSIGDTEAVGKAMRVAVAMQCAPGERIHPNNTMLCEECPPGTFNQEADSDVCYAVRPGYKAPERGQAEPLRFPCEEGTYAPSPGSAECTRCPGGEGTTSPPASTNVESCLCKTGYWRAGSGLNSACKECDADRVDCSEEGAALPKPATDGIYIDVSAAENPNVSASEAIKQCWPKSACIQFSTVSGVRSGSCSEGYTGVACLQCQEGYYRVMRNGAGHCEKCTNVSPAGVAIALLALFTLLVLWAQRAANTRTGVIALSTALNFVQVLSYLRNFNFSWPENTIRLLGGFALFNFDFLHLSPPECQESSRYSYVDRVWLISLVPPIVGGFVLFVLPLCLTLSNAVLKFRSEGFPTLRSVIRTVRQKSRKTLSAFVLLLYWAYLKLANVSLEFFSCVERNDQLVLRADPSVKCFRGRHGKLVPVAVIAMLVYTVGIPVFFFVVLRQLGSRSYADAAQAAGSQMHSKSFKRSSDSHDATVSEEGVSPRPLSGRKVIIDELLQIISFAHYNYRVDRYFQTIYELMRKLTVAVLANAIISPERQLALLIFAAVLDCGYYLKRDPHSLRYMALLESVYKIITFFTVYAGLCFYIEQMTSSTTTAVDIVLVVFLSLTFVVAAISVVADVVIGVRTALNKIALQRSKARLARMRADGTVVNSLEDNLAKVRRAYRRGTTMGTIKMLRIARRLLNEVGVDVVRAQLFKTQQTHAEQNEAINKALLRLDAAMHAGKECGSRECVTNAVKEDFWLQSKLWMTLEASDEAKDAWAGFVNVIRDNWSSTNIRLHSDDAPPNTSEPSTQDHGDVPHHG